MTFRCSNLPLQSPEEVVKARQQLVGAPSSATMDASKLNGEEEKERKGEKRREGPTETQARDDAESENEDDEGR